MTEVHSCSYYCDRPECVRRHRDELRDSAFKAREGWACPETYALTLDAVKAEAKHSAELAAEVDRLRKDAERYRWLRERFDSCAADCHFAADDSGFSWRHVEQNIGAGLILDAKIDAAMKEPAK